MNASNLSVSDPGFDLSFSGLFLPSPPPDAPGSGGGGAGGPGGGGGGGMLARVLVCGEATDRLHHCPIVHRPETSVSKSSTDSVSVLNVDSKNQQL